MPELGFYFDESDIDDVVQHCVREGAFLVPDRNYDRCAHDEIRDLMEFQHCRGAGGPNLFYIVSSKYFACPLEMREVLKGGARKYFISQRNGGPTVDLFCPRVFTKNGIEFIPPGAISHHPTYWDRDAQRMVRPPESLRRFYQDLAWFIKQRSTVVRSKHRLFFVGQGATARLASGSQLGGVFAPPEQQ